MKTIIKLLPAVLLLFVMALSGCGGSEPSLPELNGTSWKLAGVYNEATKILEKLSPTDSEDCYYFTFDSDSTAKGKVCINILSVNLSSKQQGGIIGIVTAVEEIGDPGKFCNYITQVDSYTANTHELKFFFNSRQNYLLFIPR